VKAHVFVFLSRRKVSEVERIPWSLEHGRATLLLPLEAAHSITAELRLSVTAAPRPTPEEIQARQTWMWQILDAEKR